jgi:hypothetical protein
MPPFHAQAGMAAPNRAQINGGFDKASAGKMHVAIALSD